MAEEKAGAKKKRKRRRRTKPSQRRFNVYVIELDEAVLKHKRFREANPDWKEGKGCLYVGMTARTPEERFRQHKAGYRAARFVKKYGRWLRKRLYERENPMTYEEAGRMERELAHKLRKKGYAVWWN